MHKYKKGLMAVKALKTGGAVALAAYIASLVPFMAEDPYIWVPILSGILRGINNVVKHRLGFDLFQVVKFKSNP